MASEELKEYYDFITTVVHNAGQMVADGFAGPKKVEMKGNASYNLVTDHDRKVEDYITSNIRQRYPDHLVIGEESCGTGQVPPLTDSPTWLIDPIDGTINFIQGIPFVAVSVALSIKKEIVVGIVFNPIVNQFFSAVKGAGAYMNGKKINTTQNQDLKGAIIGNELSLATIPFLRERTLERIRQLTEHGVLGFRSFGSAAVALCYVANGSLDVYFTDGLQCWDVAAGILILQEAGGCASNPDGNPFDMFSRVLLSAGNKVLLDKMVAILKQCDQKTAEHVKRLMPLHKE